MFGMSISTMSRSSGQNATASAAYRSGSVIACSATGEIHNYSRKGGVEHSEIVLPAGAPSWENDRELLWNSAEEAETRKNSTVAREFLVTIPKELNREQGISLAMDFANKLVDKHGFAADVSVHKDHKKTWDGEDKDFTGYHAHILCSTRRLGRDGFGEKTRELDDKKQGSELTHYWREQWEITANKHLELAGSDVRIDHRSFKDQGIDLIPEPKIGYAAAAMERRGIETSRGNRARQIREANNERRLSGLSSEIISLNMSIEAAKAERDKKVEESPELKAYRAQMAEDERAKLALLEKFKRGEVDHLGNPTPKPRPKPVSTEKEDAFSWMSRASSERKTDNPITHGEDIGNAVLRSNEKPSREAQITDLISQSEKYGWHGYSHVPKENSVRDAKEVKITPHKGIIVGLSHDYIAQAGSMDGPMYLHERAAFKQIPPLGEHRVIVYDRDKRNAEALTKEQHTQSKNRGLSR